jgi:hypothetical protein
MSTMKSVDIVCIRKLMQEQTESIRTNFLDLLNAEERQVYESAVNSNWIKIDTALVIYKCAARILYPDDERAFEKLGAELSRFVLKGVMKIFVRIPKLEVILGKTDLMWGAYFKQGRAKLVQLERNSFELHVIGFADYPAALRKISEGHTRFLFEFIGKKNVRVQAISDDPQDWAWSITWD